MIEKQVRSIQDESHPAPWYEVEMNNDEPEIIRDSDGGTETSVTGTANVPDFADLPTPAQSAVSKDVVFAVTEGGEFIAYEKGTELAEHNISLRAHLAWYDSETDEFTVLDFVER